MTTYIPTTISLPDYNKTVSTIYDNDHFRYGVVEDRKCKWNAIYSSRNDGKSTGALEHALKRRFVYGYNICIIRRRHTERTKNKIERYFSERCTAMLISKVYSIKYPELTRFWVEAKNGELIINGADDDGRVSDIDCIGYYCSLEKSNEYKSAQFPNVKTFIYEEFLATPRSPELDNEFELLMNTISTFARNEDFEVILVGNTVNRRSQIFAAFDVNIDDIHVGELKTYRYERDNGDVNTLAVYHIPEAKAKEKNSINYYFGERKRTNVIESEWYVADYPPIENPYSLVPKQGFVLTYNQIKLFVVLAMDGKFPVMVVSQKRIYPIQYILITEKTVPERLWLSYDAAQSILQTILRFKENGWIRYDSNYAGDDLDIFYIEMRRR